MSSVQQLGAPVRMVAALAGIVLAAGPASCGDGAEDARDVAVERTTWGGMCAEGPCRSELAVEADGTWRYEANDGSSEGRLSGAELDRLREAVLATGLAEAGAPSTHCAADSDGTSFGYAWTVDGRAHEVDSCTVTIDADDPLVRELEELAERVSG